MEQNKEIRKALIAQGQVQGVGFRPFIWKLATSENLTGQVRNTSAGVRIEIQGQPAKIAAFEARLSKELPPLARLTNLQEEDLPLVAGENSFQIRHSLGHAGQNVLISPDVGLCADCLADMREPGNPRFGYAFTNCVNCGPRYTITKAIPYDRPTTAMACFELCEKCAAEYGNPADRRFHAQPIACPKCGPSLRFIEKGNQESEEVSPWRGEDEALARAGTLLLGGGILALKGLGGFQLVCDARNAAAVTRLRQNKLRPSKALAVMARSAAEASLFCAISRAESRLLESPEKSIVLCPVLPNPARPLVAEIASDTDKIGIMLPYTPLHALLFDWLGANGMEYPVLVMTSGNARDEPICLGNREALASLKNMADAWLLHNRDILVRVDDSVVAPLAADDLGMGQDMKGPMIIRRARGYTPRPVNLAFGGNLPPILGVGAELKSTFCLTRGDRAFVSQHIGDLKNLLILEFFTHTLRHMRNILEVEPQVVVRDLHPDFISSKFAEDLARENKLPLYSLQHHAAHAVSVLAEHGFEDAALALCLDGAGLGDDGSIWGGELLLVDMSAPSWKRLGRLTPFALPGGDAATREIWRIARALQIQTGHMAPLAGVSPQQLAIIDEMLAKNLSCPLSSSCGRLFDALAASLGICHNATYEGQAAIMLEKEASRWFRSNIGKRPPGFADIAPSQKGDLLELDSASIFQAACKAMASGIDKTRIAASFHHSLALGLAQMAAIQAKKLNLTTVALGGGVLQNRLMLHLLRDNLRELGLAPLLPLQMPAGDGGISLGQALWGMKMYAALK